MNLDTGRLARSPRPERCEASLAACAAPRRNSPRIRRSDYQRTRRRPWRRRHVSAIPGHPGTRRGPFHNLFHTPLWQPQQMFVEPIWKIGKRCHAGAKLLCSFCRGSKESDILDAWADLLEEHSQTTSSALVACIVDSRSTSFGRNARGLRSGSAPRESRSCWHSRGATTRSIVTRWRPVIAAATRKCPKLHLIADRGRCGL